MLCTLAASSTAAQPVLYDNFQHALSPDKWLAGQVYPGGMELVRELRDGQLFLAYRVLGNTTRSTGGTESLNRRRFRAGRSLSAVRFTVTVQAVTVQGCAVPGSAISRSTAGFSSNLFNDGSSSGAADGTGTIGVFLGVERRSDSVDPPGSSTSSPARPGV